MVGNILGAGIMSAGSLLAAAYQARKQEEINKRNLEYQQEANKLSIDLANTAHQREVADLRAAGLNPILSAGGSGAQTPSIGAVQAENPYNGLSNSASAVSREIGRLFTEQTELANEQTSAQTENIRAMRVQIESDAELKKAMADSIRAGRGIIDLGTETVRPVAESFGDWLGNSAFKAKEWLKDNVFNVFQGRDRSPARYLWKGRRMTLEQIYDDDPDHYMENLRRIMSREK